MILNTPMGMIELFSPQMNRSQYVPPPPGNVNTSYEAHCLRDRLNQLEGRNGDNNYSNFGRPPDNQSNTLQQMMNQLEDMRAKADVQLKLNQQLMDEIAALRLDMRQKDEMIARLSEQLSSLHNDNTTGRRRSRTPDRSTDEVRPDNQQQNEEVKRRDSRNRSNSQRRNRSQRRDNSQRRNSRSPNRSNARSRSRSFKSPPRKKKQKKQKRKNAWADMTQEDRDAIAFKRTYRKKQSLQSHAAKRVQVAKTRKTVEEVNNLPSEEKQEYMETFHWKTQKNAAFMRNLCQT